ncbi:hypothetical protein N658DRAFT_561197 [Parathielavia hyrcaniae]|uniref:ribonuclease H n=1 Tax=Parathielavia hyrcaniae TaxID=113614 RepID=A0AAN6SZ54_9PEZI|nr:hypothetical protein N658DRAFT_561197 [Parathielavia hyrcaniae]
MPVHGPPAFMDDAERYAACFDYNCDGDWDINSDDYYSDDSSGSIEARISDALEPRCLVCSETSELLKCGRCKVVSYCGAAHQKSHQSKHKADCNAIQKAKQALEREDAALRNPNRNPLLHGEGNPFDSGVGHFWGISGTRDYMRARYAAAEALLKVPTQAAVEMALDHFTDMLRLNRSDNMGLRDIIPGLLMRLGREQECYDFIKWWATVSDDYDWGDVALPYLDVRNADVFEPVDQLCAGNMSLSHLAMLTLLKLSLHLDLNAHHTGSMNSSDNYMDHYEGFDRPPGRLAQAIIRRDKRNISTAAETLEDQYHTLCQVVHEANPHFWDALVDDGGGEPTMPVLYSRGSPEEAQMVLYHCKRAWQESEDALVMIEADTCSFVPVYKGPSPLMPPTTLNFWTCLSGHDRVRFVNAKLAQVLVFVDGACSNGQDDPRAGWAVVHGLDEVASGRVEDEGPFGDRSVATSNRAELRAAITALRLSDWDYEGFTGIVIAADSSYVVDGATSWTKTWVRNGWKTKNRDRVKNRDLWELLLGDVERLDGYGIDVSFWRIPREQNADADVAAKKAAEKGTAEPKFRDVILGTPEHRSTTTAANSGAPAGRRILALSLEYADLFEDIFGSLVSQIFSKAAIERAATYGAAISALSQGSAPDVILVTDAAITRRRNIFELVADQLYRGSTVVLMGCFSNMVNGGQFDRFFARLGLPWTHGCSYQRVTTKLRREAVGDRLADRLPSEYSQKALFVKSLDRSAAWYAEEETSTEAAVAMAKVGAGKLGYVGDVNGEDGSNAAVLAMCGLLG